MAKQYSTYIGKSDAVHHLVTANGNTTDIMNTVLLADAKNGAYCGALARMLNVPGKPVDTCYNIWKFWKDNVKYVEDPDGYQYIKSPAYLYETGTGDCKSFSVAVGACLKQLSIPYAYRFITQQKGQPYHHVYVVAYTQAGAVFIDCVIDYFNRQNPFAGYKDMPAVAPAKPAAIGKLDVGGGKLDITTPYTDGNGNRVDVVPDNPVINYWVQMVNDYRNNIDTKKKVVFGRLFQGVWQHWAGKPLKQSIVQTKLLSSYEQFADCAFAMAYKFWNDATVPLPADLEAKRQLGSDLYDNLVSIGARDADLRAMCDLGIYNMYGFPLDYMYYRAQNLLQYGQPWQPVPNVPYFDVRTGTLVANGADINKVFQIAACLPYVAQGQTNIIGMPYGVPYWSIGGWLMQNGASTEMIRLYLKTNPNRPPINTGNNPTDAERAAAVGTYNDWLNGNLACLPTVLTNNNTNRIKVSGIGAPVAEIIGAVVAVIVAIITITTTIVKLVQSAKSVNPTNVNTPEFKRDFKELYQTVDGCIMYSGPTGFTKCCPNGQCQQNVNPNDPQNQAAAGSFAAGGGIKWLLLTGIALIAVFIFSGKSSKN